MSLLPFEPRPSKGLPRTPEGAGSPCEGGAALDGTGGIITYIMQRYHKVHREELPGLVVLARELEKIQDRHPDLPRGFADFLEEMAESLETHMLMEEHVLFPLLTAGHPKVRPTIEFVRREHDAHDYRLEALEEYIGALRPPAGARASWRALYNGLVKFASDLNGHIRIENEVLFPRFDS